MLCPQCGRENVDGAGFCAGCGAPLASSYQAYAQPGYQPNPQSQSGYQPNAQPQQPGYQSGPQQQPGCAPTYPVYTPIGPNPPTNRNIAVCVLLSIVTCGIYGLYWFYCIVNELNTASGHPEDTSGGMVILFTIITCGIYGYYWYYKAGEKVAEVKWRQTGLHDSGTSILYLVLSLLGLGIINDCLIQSELNRLAPIR